MTNKPITKKIILGAILFFFTAIIHAQLPDFTLNVTATPQTCLGNGTLSFTVTGNNSTANIDYAVYLLPNTTTPITVTTANSATGLVAGNYMVVATQSLGNESNTSSENATIVNQVVALTYTLSQTKVQCGNDGKITVNVTTGNPVSYEILTGPVTVPQQSSNIFNNLPTGIYGVRVYDNCGEAVVVTIQVLQDTTDINILPVSFVGGPLPDCNTITVANDFGLGSGGSNIFWPLTFQYTVFPPGGGTPVIVTETIATGTINELQAAIANIPFYNNQEYYYNLKVTDACGNVFTENNNIVNQQLEFTYVPDFTTCNEIGFIINPNNFVGPVTINFIDSPADFNPTDFSQQHPVFAADALYKLAGTSVPLGFYTVELTDSCGRVTVQEFEVTPPQVSPQVEVTAICGSDVGNVEITIPGSGIVTVIITNAPDAYGTFPDDVSDGIDNGVFTIQNLPLGPYVFTITDDCGQEFIQPVEVIVNGGNPNVSVLQRPGCETGVGSIRLNASGDFATVTITDGPAEFSDTYPVDVSANIAPTGDFYMNSLPEGDYEFFTVDVCDVERIKEVTVNGYEIQVNDLEVIPYCGSFQINFDHFSNGNYVQAFWLQHFDETTGTWGHPETGFAYNDGLPNNINSIYINVNDDTPFYFAVGDFRIIKSFYTYSNGSTFNNLCLDVLHEFTFTGGPQITEVYSFPCAGGLTEVAVIVEGVPPFTYKITSKDGEPFLIDNGDSSIFSGLEPAYYNFQVTDACENIVNAQFNINAIDPFDISASGFCDGEESFLFVQPFSFLTYEWYAESDPQTILSTTNSLTFPSFNSATDSGTYFVNLVSDDQGSCMNQTLQYEVMPNPMPNAGNDETAALCNEGNAINLNDYLSTIHDEGGAWEDTDATGALNGSTLNPGGIAAGTYNFKYTVVNPCGFTDEAVVTLTLNDAPASPLAAPVAAICEGETIQLSLTPVAGVSYIWTGPNDFSSTNINPVIANAGTDASGTYSVSATANGCTSQAATVNVTVKAMPDFTISGNTALCEGQSSILNVSPQNFDVSDVSYTWYYNGELLTDITGSSIEVFETGVYEVAVNNDNCIVPSSVNVTPDALGFEVVVEQGCNNFSYVLSIANANQIAGLDFVWTGPDGFYHTGEEAVITDLSAGEYFVNITNADGCSVTGSAFVENTSCMIPRGISPNNDGYNQSFDLSSLNVLDLQILNRYGLQVYEKKNYRNEWHGQSDKGTLPTGTYFYIITLSAGKQVTGWVYLQQRIN